MALSFYSNWETLHEQQHHNNILETELSLDLLGFQDEYNNTFIDYPIFDPDDDDDHHHLFLSHNYYNNLLPYSASPLDNNSNSLEEIDPYPYPKHQKCCCEDYYYYNNYLDLTPVGLFNGFVPNPPLLPEFYSPPVFYASGSTSVKSSSTISTTTGGGGERLSAQSMAARERRRKISEKTQELGKLIPGGGGGGGGGGHKIMNTSTAEMFQAAFKYIKYMQAQVGILQLMASFQVQDNEEPLFDTPEVLQKLVSSPHIQEKLYSSEKCLVPKQFVQTLANDLELQSKSLILTDLHQLIGTSGSLDDMKRK